MQPSWISIFGFIAIVSSICASEDVQPPKLRKTRQTYYNLLAPQPYQQFFQFPFNWPFIISAIPGPGPQIIQQIQISNTTTSEVPTTELTSISPENTDLDRQDGSQSCGKAAVYATTRIVDGDNAMYGEFPWLVAIMKTDGSHLCGGSLISSTLILSAAHCFAHYRGEQVQQLRVFIGDFNIYDSRDVKHQVRSVKRLIRHARWNGQNNYNDVALLKLDHPVQFTKYVQPICLAGDRPTFYSSGTYATVAGWGKVQFGHPVFQSTPLKISVPLVDKTTCRNSIYPYSVTDSMICAGSGYKSTCLGDSGGPLTVYSGGRWYQVGIVSWGLGCSGYGVYTRVSSFRSWIDQFLS